MTKIYPLQASFNAGELSPRLHARVDFIRYPAGLEECENLIPLPEGGLTRRPATRFVAEIVDSTKKGRMIGFEATAEQHHALELGENKIRFYFRQGQQVVLGADSAIINGTFGSIDSAFSQVWQVDDTPTDNAFVDETTDANSAANADWTVFTAAEAIGDYVALGFTTVFAQVRFDYANGTAGVGGVVAWEYWNGTAWTALAGVVDNTTGFTAAVADNLTASWTIPTDWATRTISTSASLFFVRAKITTVYSTNPVLDQGFIRASWVDKSTGGVGNQISIDTVNDRLTLETNGSASDDIGWVEQVLTTVFILVPLQRERVIKFEVIGDPGDKIEFQVGSTSTGSETLSPVEKQVGFHCVAFTPTTSQFYVQFRNLGSNADKDVQIDNVSIIDDSALEIDSPYTEAQLFQIMGAQSNDLEYLFRSGVAPYKLERRGLTSWSLVKVAWEDGPYIEQNSTATTLTPAATSGVAVTVTASSIVGINEGKGFLSTDVGRLVRIDNGAAWGWGIIVTFTDTTNVDVHVKKAFAATSATADWRLGAWSDTTGWPKTGGFFEQRLYVASTDDQPETLWGSQTADFENFKPDDDNNVVEDDDAFDFTLSADSVNEIRWLSAGEDTLAIGTAGGEWVPSASGIVITPLDITIRRQTTHGSALVAPLRVDHVVLFVQKAKRKIREFVFNFEFDSFLAPDVTRLAQHITVSGIVEMTFQQEPDSLVWAVRADGVVPTMTFRRDEDVVAWARQIIGGSFSGKAAVVDSITSIIGTDDSSQVQNSGDRDEVWLIVKRTINGNTRRYVEFVEGYYDDLLHDQEDAYYADSIITYDDVLTTSIAGLSHLEGETVKVWGDGAILPDVKVTDGKITLATAVKVAQIGLAYRHRLKTLKIEGGNPAGTAVGRKKRINSITFVLRNSHTLTFGPDDDNKFKKDFRLVGSPMDAGVPLFTGEQSYGFDGGLAPDTRIIVESDDPAPFTLLAMVPEVVVMPSK